MQFYHILKISVAFLWAGLSIVSLFSCKEDKAGQGAIEEIRTEGKISSIIRSPVTASGLKDTASVARMEFEEKIYDFGEVEEGDIVSHTFHFTNTGKAPLVISDAHSTCGCTVPQWPKDPIPPGGKGTIEVTFNTKNKTRRQEKPVIISANTYPSVNKVYLKGYVRPLEE